VLFAPLLLLLPLFPLPECFDFGGGMEAASDGDDAPVTDDDDVNDDNEYV
jgi:hypothetical protein